MIKWVNAQKGQGFILPDDGSKNVFAHVCAMEHVGLSGLNEGQKIRFDEVSVAVRKRA
jgi:cold shock protein